MAYFPMYQKYTQTRKNPQASPQQQQKKNKQHAD